MEYLFENIEEVLEKRWCNKCKIDYLLHVDAIMYSNLGADSTQRDRDRVKRKSRKIYNNIKKIDREIGERFLSSMDKL
mgnify:CR=1 FL=1|jgi:hypothetical protein|tara:strand:+ start:1782 stop:2015 length:234 start_codon:yes stop_codon:yes gene_type:complete